MDKNYTSVKDNNYLNLNYSDNIIKEVTNTNNKIKDNKNSDRENHFLFENNFNYNDINHINELRNKKVTLRDAFKHFVILKPSIVRYSLPNMNIDNFTDIRLKKKYHVLKNRVNTNPNFSKAESLSRIYKNINLKHKTYATQSVGNYTNNNTNALKLIGNKSLRLSGKTLNPKSIVLNLHTNNGGNSQVNNKNYTINSETPLIGFKFKKTFNEISKHKFNHSYKMKMFQ